MRTALEVSASAQTEVGPLAPSSGTRENYKDKVICVWRSETVSVRIRDSLLLDDDALQE